MDGIILGPSLPPPGPAKSASDLVIGRMNQFQKKAAQINGLTGKTSSFQDLATASDKLAQALLRRELSVARPSDRPKCFALFCENGTEVLIALLAVLKCRIPALLVGWSDKDDLDFFCSSQRPEVVVCSSGCLAAILAAAPKMPWLREVFVANAGADLPEVKGHLRVRSLERFLAEFQLEEMPNIVYNDEETCLIVPPDRGAMVQMCSLLSFDQIGFAVRQMLAGDFSGGFGWTENDTILNTAPVCSALGASLALGILALGATQVLVTGTNARNLQIALQSQPVTQLLISPEPARALAQRATAAPFTPTHLRGVLVIGNISRAVRGALLAWLPVVEVRTAMVDVDECCTQLLVSAVSAAWPDCRGAVGSPAPGVRAFIADVHTGCCLGAFCVGELMLRRDKDAQWSRTGSLAYYDRAGMFFLVNRLKSVVKARLRHVS